LVSDEYFLDNSVFKRILTEKIPDCDLSDIDYSIELMSIHEYNVISEFSYYDLIKAFNSFAAVDYFQ